MDVSVCRGEVGGEGEVVYFVEDLGGVLLVLAVDRGGEGKLTSTGRSSRFGMVRRGMKEEARVKGGRQDEAIIRVDHLHPWFASAW